MGGAGGEGEERVEGGEEVEEVVVQGEGRGWGGGGHCCGWVGRG